MKNIHKLPHIYERIAEHYAQFKKRTGLHVTDLLKPIRVLMLQSRHTVEEDISEMVRRWKGDAWHQYMEQFTGKNDLSEEKLVTNIGGQTISGRPDLYEGDTGTLVDFKTTTTWKPIFHEQGDTGWADDCFWQLNFYAVILREYGFPVKSLEIHAELEDWSKSKASRDGRYPRSPMWVLKAKPKDDEEVRKVMAQAVKQIADNASKKDDELPLCTPEERWAKKEVFAVMKEGRKSAVKLHETQADAKRHLEGLGAGHSIVKRPGEDLRCTLYCSVCEHCAYWKETYGGVE